MTNALKQRGGQTKPGAANTAVTVQLPAEMVVTIDAADGAGRSTKIRDALARIFGTPHAAGCAWCGQSCTVPGAGVDISAPLDLAKLRRAQSLTNKLGQPAFPYSSEVIRWQSCYSCRGITDRRGAGIHDRVLVAAAALGIEPDSALVRVVLGREPNRADQQDVGEAATYPGPLAAHEVSGREPDSIGADVRWAHIDIPALRRAHEIAAGRVPLQHADGCPCCRRQIIAPGEKTPSGRKLEWVNEATGILWCSACWAARCEVLNLPGEWTAEDIALGDHVGVDVARPGLCRELGITPRKLPAAPEPWAGVNTDRIFYLEQQRRAAAETLPPAGVLR